MACTTPQPPSPPISLPPRITTTTKCFLSTTSPSSFSMALHQKKLQEERITKTCTVFSLAWSPDDRYLAGCSSFGIICVWDVIPPPDNDIIADNTNSNDAPSSSREKKRKRREKGGINEPGDDPVLKLSASKKALYHLQFCTVNDVIYIMAAGYDGILIYRWSDVISFEETASPPSPVKRLTPYPSPREADVEINAVSFDPSRNVVYGAAGDLFGCYQWDFESGKLLRTLRGGVHEEYLHCVVVLDDGSCVLTGGEDGKLCLWEADSGNLIEMYNIRSILKPPKSGVSPKITDKKYHSWVSSIATSANSKWAVIGGGISPPFQKDFNGYLLLLHLPSRTFSSSTMTRETIQHVAYDCTHDKIISLGNENVISYWSCFDLDDASGGNRAWCTTPSGYGVAVNETSKVTAVAGVGSVIDGFVGLGQRGFTLSFR